MDALCEARDAACGLSALAAALHALHLYCAALAAGLVACCAPPADRFEGSARWRGQNVRGAASVVQAAAAAAGAAAAALRPGARAALAAAALGAAGALAAGWLHVLLWSRGAAAPLLYLAVYWLLGAAAAAAQLTQLAQAGAGADAVDVYVQGLLAALALVMAAVDCLCFYDEVVKRFHKSRKPASAEPAAAAAAGAAYQHHEAHFYSRVTFFWLNAVLRRGVGSAPHPAPPAAPPALPPEEASATHYRKFRDIYRQEVGKEKRCMWRCYVRMVWPNFYCAGVLKLCSDMLGVVPPLGLGVIIRYVEEAAGPAAAAAEAAGAGPAAAPDRPVSVAEFLDNGYVMLLLVALALAAQALLSQNSTHLVTVEGTRLKTALQGMIYDKCLRLAPWAGGGEADEEAPLLLGGERDHAGLVTNLVAQDAYNVMSCVWICHYTWAIPLKVSVILYLLYTKLGISAIIGAATSILVVTPLQFYIGKKISENSKEVSKCTDHRISKMSEIIQGMNVIKLYVWEDLFMEKILNLREMELKLLNKDSIYWNLLTFTTQMSSTLLTGVTFMLLYHLDGGAALTAARVFAGLALLNQLTIPLLVLPVTVLMIIQAAVSTNRIKEFLDLPEANNVAEDDNESLTRTDQNINDLLSKDDCKSVKEAECERDDAEEAGSDEDARSLPPDSLHYLAHFKDAAFAWGRNESPLMEIDELDLPTGKVIMVVGATGSGKSSFLSAVLGEMYLERGEVQWNEARSTSYAGQPPWLVEGSVRENIVMHGAWCARRYDRVLRAAGLKPDLHLMPDGDRTVISSGGAPLSGGQRVRVATARALYAAARVLCLDEPLAALDAGLARRVLARGLRGAARAGRTVLLATNRIELMHYADLIIVIEDGRVAACGRAGGEGALGQWARLAAEACAAAARAGERGGAARERARLVRALSQARFQRDSGEDVALGASELSGRGVHQLAEAALCGGGGSWRAGSLRTRPALARRLPDDAGLHGSLRYPKHRRDVRRVASAAAAAAAAGAEAGAGRRLLRPRSSSRPLGRWTPRPLRRLLSSDSETAHDDSNVDTAAASLEVKNTTVTLNGVQADPEPLQEPEDYKEPSEWVVWWWWWRACGAAGAAHAAAAAAAQGCALGADCWLAVVTARNADRPLTGDQMWESIRWVAVWCGAGLACAAAAGGAAAGAAHRARRRLHERALSAALHAAAPAPAAAATLHRFSADVHALDKKLPTAVSRWLQLALVCLAATLAAAAVAPWTLLALAPAAALYLVLQNIYLNNATELQRAEARSAAPVVGAAREAGAGGASARAGRLQPALRAAYLRRLDDNHASLLMLNAANRWLGLTLDLVGAACAAAALGVCALALGARGAALAGAASLQLPLYLAHAAKARADLRLQLLALARLHQYAALPQDDYRENCPLPHNWQRSGRLELQHVTARPEPRAAPAVTDVSLVAQPGEKVAICGRSGSGKTTLLLACVGAAPLAAGRVLLDGADVGRVPLRALRHRVVVLPQEPVLFSGTLRENLDPLGVHTDREIWDSLRLVGLYEFVAAQTAGLECSVSSGGSGARWSGGRAARACAARAALRAGQASVLLLDEPGAALPAAAERALLRALAAPPHAPHLTVVTVAHRVSSVRGYTRAVVMERGRAAEQGPPAALLAQPHSRFAALCLAAQDA